MATESGGKLLSAAGYARLLRDVGGLIEAGRLEAEAKAGHVLAVTYWTVGARIGREALSSRAGYGEGVVTRLADELGISEVSLRRAVRFAAEYAAPPKPGLSWAHYQELLLVGDRELRASYAQRALTQGWSRRVLRDAIAGKLLAGGAMATHEVTRPSDGSWLYRCEVSKVIDGDTLIAHVDLGFEVVKVQRVRLAKVDAAEVKTPEGKRVAQWVRETLAQAGAVVLTTEKASDVHGRYVGHVFYSGDADASAQQVFEAGTYLNAELVAKGLAQAV